MHNLYKELGVSLKEPAVLYCDSKSALQIVANPVFHERTKHIEIDCHFIRERIQQGLVRALHVDSKNQVANILTKALGRAQHDFLANKLGLLNVFNESSLRGVLELLVVNGGY